MAVKPKIASRACKLDSSHASRLTLLECTDTFIIHIPRIIATRQRHYEQKRQDCQMQISLSCHSSLPDAATPRAPS